MCSGKKIIGASLCLTLILWIATLSDDRFIRQDPFLFFSKIVALTGTIAMCWTFLLSTRLNLLETLFSGLDKVYHTHRMLGITSYVLIFFHPVFQFFRFAPHWKSAKKLFHFYRFTAVECGILAFLLFTVLIAITLFMKIPYHIWKKTHEFFIFVLLFTLLHTVVINRQVNASLWLSIWVYGFIALAVLSYLYIRFLYRYIGPRYGYQIEKIEKKGKVWNVHLKPLDQKMKFKPAQFVYVSFLHPKLSKEPHPFSISSSPDQPSVRISIKAQGDYTSKLDVLSLQDQALIWGPYGKFYEKPLIETKKDVVMIGAGIGITPFLSMLHFEAQSSSQRALYIFYCTKNKDRSYFEDEIKDLAKNRPSIHYVPWYSDHSGFMSIADVEEKVEGGLKNKLFLICGPIAMMKLFTRQLNQKGVKNKQIVFEDFNLLD